MTVNASWAWAKDLVNLGGHGVNLKAILAEVEEPGPT
jgi:hypothetical protein